MAKFFISLIVIASFGFIAADTARAQNELTLDDCIEIALANRATIIRARGNEDLARAQRLAALGAFLPRVNASYSYVKGKEYNIDPLNRAVVSSETVLDTTVINGQTAIDAIEVPTQIVETDEQDIGPSKRLGASADITLFSLSNIFGYAAAGAGVQAASLNVLASEQDLIYTVKQAYYAYLATMQNVTVQEQAVERSEEQLKLIQSRFDLGSASKSDVLKQKVQYGNDRLSLLQAQNAVVQTRADLSYTIGLDPQKDHNFSSSYESREAAGTLEGIIEFGLQNNPELLSQEAAATQTGRNVRAAYSEYLPTLNGFIDYQSFDGTQAFPFTIDFSSDQYTYGLSVNWNIFDGFRREYDITSAKVARNNARADLADQRNLTVSSIKTAYMDIERIKEQEEVAQENVDAAEEDLKITQEKYNLGAATILDLLESQVSLKQAQVQLIRASFDLNLAIARLDRALGRR
jgi:outer membrane protein